MYAWLHLPKVNKDAMLNLFKISGELDENF